MGRPLSRKVNLKKGYYIEVKRSPAGQGMKIRRETIETIRQAYRQYKAAYLVEYLGRYEDGSFHKDEKME
jgi:hypothetical protein